MSNLTCVPVTKLEFYAITANGITNSANYPSPRIFFFMFWIEPTIQSQTCYWKREENVVYRKIEYRKLETPYSSLINNNEVGNIKKLK